MKSRRQTVIQDNGLSEMTNHRGFSNIDGYWSDDSLKCATKGLLPKEGVVNESRSFPKLMAVNDSDNRLGEYSKRREHKLDDWGFETLEDSELPEMINHRSFSNVDGYWSDDSLKCATNGMLPKEAVGKESRNFPKLTTRNKRDNRHGKYSKKGQESDKQDLNQFQNNGLSEASKHRSFSNVDGYCSDDSLKCATNGLLRKKAGANEFMGMSNLKPLKITDGQGVEESKPSKNSADEYGFEIFFHFHI